jgi:serine/threonine protein kinase
MSTKTNQLVGRTLEQGRYRIVRQLGEGGMGTVFLADDTKLDTSVVIKIPHVSGLQSDDICVRFQREVKALIALSHPHIVKVYDVGEMDGVPFAVMQFLGGGSLEDRRPKSPDGLPQPVPPDTVRDWLGDIARALDFVHERGLLHRDVKPANILFDPQGHVFLSDFGVAKALAGYLETQRGQSITAQGVVLGTPEYMAPEVILGHPMDGRADQYALAVTLFEMLSARRPFEEASPSAVFVAACTKPPPDVRSFNQAISPPLAAVLRRAMDRDPAQRYANCAQLAAAFQDALTPPPPSPAALSKPPPRQTAFPASAPDQATQTSKQSPIATWIAIGSALAIAAVVVVYLAMMMATPKRNEIDLAQAPVSPSSPETAPKQLSPPPLAQPPAGKAQPASPVAPEPKDKAPSSLPPESKPASQTTLPPRNEPVPPNPKTESSAIGSGDALPPVVPKASSPQPTPPTPSQPAELLASVPESWDLPEIESSAPTKLFSMSYEPQGALEIAIDSRVASIPAGAAIVAESSPDSRSWSALFVPNVAPGATAQKTPLATISCDSRDFVFSWAADASQPEIARQLSNCRLKLDYHNVSKVVQLRPRIKHDPLKLNLSDENQVLELPAADLPRADTVRLEIRKLSGFPPDAQVRGEKSIALERQAIIEFTSLPGAEIRLRFNRIKEKLVLRMEPVFKETSARVFDLTIVQLDKLVQGARRELPKDSGDLNAAQATLSHYQDEIQRWRSMVPSNLNEQNARTQALMTATREAEKAGNRVNALQKQVAGHQARLNAAPKIREFINSLHQKAAIEYVVYAECGEQDIILLQAATDGT